MLSISEDLDFLPNVSKQVTALENSNFDQYNRAFFIVEDKCPYSNVYKYTQPDLRNAISAINNNENNFYFFPLKELQKLNELFDYIDQLHQEVLYISEVQNISDTIEKELKTFIPKSNITRHKLIVSTISHVLNDLSLIFENNDFEIILRAIPKYPDMGCEFWHIDKNYKEISETFDQDKLKLKKDFSKVVLLTLTGETTIYYPANDISMDNFYKYSNETTFVYGRTHLCNNPKDKFLALFSDSEIISLPKFYGAVHTTGYHGAIHSQPRSSTNGRLFISITPLINTNMEKI